MEGICRLCGTTTRLRESHIVPAFVYRWLKETSGTGYLRGGAAPNLRMQDGLKDYWLCGDCEERFSVWETAFANQVYYPCANLSARNLRYGEWMLKFCMSLCWRVLTFIQEHGTLDHLSSELAETSLLARDAWASCLLGLSPHPGVFEQHVLLVDEIARHTGSDLPPTINRYLLRTVDIDVAGSNKESLVYVKLPHVIVLGIIRVPKIHQWVGTKIHVKKGFVGPSRTVVSAALLNFIVDRANGAAATMKNGLSESQRKKIDASFAAREAQFPDTGTFKAMAADIRLSGRWVNDEGSES